MRTNELKSDGRREYLLGVLSDLMFVQLLRGLRPDEIILKAQVEIELNSLPKGLDE